MVQNLDESQLATRLCHVPSPLPYLGYCFFFPAMLIGPSLDYATYDSLVRHTIYTQPPPGTGPEQIKATRRRIPYGRKRVAYLHLAIGLGFLGVYAVYGGRGSYSRVLGDDWAKWGLLTRFGFVQFAGIIARTKYYAVWSLSEVSETPWTSGIGHLASSVFSAEADRIGRVYPHRDRFQWIRSQDGSNALEQGAKRQYRFDRIGRELQGCV
jgi:hypothetical protein